MNRIYQLIISFIIKVEIIIKRLYFLVHLYINKVKTTLKMSALSNQLKSIKFTQNALKIGANQ